MSLFTSQKTWKPTIEPITGNGDTLNNLQKLTMGAGANRFEANIKDGLWLGGDTFATAKISMSFPGILKASDVVLTGGSISNISLGALAPGSAPSIQGWTSDLTFSATDHDTVAWTSGSIKLSDGTTFTISAGNTGNITAVNYVYLDTDTSETVLQTTTTATTAVGTNKILVAVAENVASGKKAIFQAFGGKGGINPLIVADNIAANTITANEIFTNTITASELATDSVTATKIDVSLLSAISANMGSITAGKITGGTFISKALGTSSGRSCVIDGDSKKNIKFYHNNTLSGWLATSLHTSGEDEYLRLEVDSGRSLRFRESRIECNGNFTPDSDNDYTCGSSANRWSDGRFEDLNVDDLTVNTGCSGCGYAELNYLTEKQRDAFYAARNKKFTKNNKKKWKEINVTGFEEGDVLAMKKGKLVKCKIDACGCVRGVSNNRGLPIIFGDEPIKVIGQVRENDFLVGSRTPGFARAWNKKEGEPPCGAVIGQADEDKFTEEKGRIMAGIFKR